MADSFKRACQRREKPLQLCRMRRSRRTTAKTPMTILAAWSRERSATHD
jgi:hypothetical protein